MPNSFAIIGSPHRILVQAALSALGIGLVYGSLYPQAPGIIKAVMLFYAPAWIFTNAVFGGPHDAPAWSYWPSIILAVVGQNALAWKLIIWVRSKAK
jgi:hypothetical protein